MNQINDFNRGLYLSDLRKGDEGIIDGIENYKENLVRLGDMGLHKGIAFRVINFAPLGDPIEIKIRGFYLSVRKAQANCIRVKKKVKGGQ
jgi:ferrous iron transport protein A